MPTERQSLIHARRIVVKVGTAVVRRPDGALALGRLGALVEQLHELRGQGREVLLVSSGAVGLGAERLKIDPRKATVVDRQACAAAGQGTLMAHYDASFSRLGHRCAQVLLTEEDFHHRARYVNLAATLQRLLALGAVPIVNENDTTSIAGVRWTRGEVFGDNDRLAALVASGLGCDALVLLTDVDGLHTGPPGQPGSERIPVYRGEDVRFGATSAGGRGGMATKVDAAKVAARAGTTAAIASGYREGGLLALLRGDDLGTVFPAESGLSSRRRWLAFATAPSGRLLVNEGARDAVVRRKASLLPIGVVAVQGTFGAGDVVSLVHSDEEFARGICARSSDDLSSGGPSRSGRARALVHRDHLVVLVAGEEP